MRAVVAVAAFATLADAVHSHVRHYLPGWLVTDAQIEAAIEAAGALAGFDLADVRPVDSVARTHAGILLIHGSRDDLLPPSNSVRLHEAGGNPTTALLVIDGADHDSIMREPAVLGEAVRWLDAWMRR